MLRIKIAKIFTWPESHFYTFNYLKLFLTINDILKNKILNLRNRVQMSEI